VPGRLFLDETAGAVARAFAAAPADAPGPRPEIAPGDAVLAIVAGPRRQVAMRWGMIPMGRRNARGRPVLETIVNARSETLFAKSAFQNVRRCIVPVSGWYEGTGPPRRKIRWAITARDGGLLALAGIWDVWAAPGGAEVASLATVTCAPNADVAAIHPRMPAILEPDGWPVWLGEADGDPAPLLRPAADGLLSVGPADTPLEA